MLDGQHILGVTKNLYFHAHDLIALMYNIYRTHCNVIEVIFIIAPLQQSASKE